jgi:murein DD-endopeptidase MepM/ murein hydrolase activator NlpD
LTVHRTFTTIPRPAITATLALLLAAPLALIGPTPAAANDYPTWAEVEAARASESTKRAQITALQSELAALGEQTKAAEETASLRGAEYETAQARFDDASLRADELQTQADDAATTAEESGRQAGQVAAMLGRSAGTDLTLRLLMDADADDFLVRLGSLSKVTELASRASQQAVVDRNTATTLTEQADVAKSLRGDLAATAEAALAAAIEAQAAAQAALEAARQSDATMRAQLAVLTEDRAATEADYQKGEAARRAAEAEAARRAAEAAAAAAAGGGAAPSVGGQGWVRPVSGWISSPFGPRPQRPVAGVNPYHYATDIAASCSRPVAAASAGTVSYAGWLGSYGLWVLIDHGNGVQTGYAHNGSLLVSPGQTVSAGTTIALVGTTGASTGCHVHFEVRANGARIDPVPFMRARGVSLG